MVDQLTGKKCELLRSTATLFRPLSRIEALDGSQSTIREHFQHGLHLLVAQASEHCSVRVHGVVGAGPTSACPPSTGPALGLLSGVLPQVPSMAYSMGLTLKSLVVGKVEETRRHSVLGVAPDEPAAQRRHRAPIRQ